MAILAPDKLGQKKLPAGFFYTGNRYLVSTQIGSTGVSSRFATPAEISLYLGQQPKSVLPPPVQPPRYVPPPFVPRKPMPPRVPPPAIPPPSIPRSPQSPRTLPPPGPGTRPTPAVPVAGAAGGLMLLLVGVALLSGARRR